MSDHGEEEGQRDEAFTMRAIFQHFERLNTTIGDLRDRIDQQGEEIAQMRQPRERNGRVEGYEGEEEGGARSDYYRSSGSDGRSNRSNRSNRRGERRGNREDRFREGRRHEERRRDRVDDDLGSIKLKVPSFHGRNDPEAYLEWEKKVELVFECHNYSELKKVKLAVVEFTDYAITWWDQLVTNRRRNYEEPIETWRDLKSVLRKRFIPAHYYRDLHHKLQSLRQGSHSVEDYYKEMEVAMIRANVVEDREATLARFLNGLNREIANVVELQHYVELEDLLHLAIKVEKQLKRKGPTKTTPPTTSPWKPSWKPDFKPKTEPTKPKEDPTFKGKQAAESSTTKNREIKCFKCLGVGHIASQCPNKRTMVLRESGEVVTESEEEVADEDDEDVEYPVSGDLLVVRRALNVQVKEEDVSQQRENIFHTRCHINDKVCCMIIDGGSCTNVASTTLVDKLDLPILRHPRPYKLQWLNECGEVKVSRQVLITFSFGKYKDEVL